MDIKKVNEKINKLPICDEGKQGVRELVEEITGMKLPVATKLKIGALYRFPNVNYPSGAVFMYFCTQVKGTKYGFVSITSGTEHLAWDEFYKENEIPRGQEIELVADSLCDYFGTIPRRTK